MKRFPQPLRRALALVLAGALTLPAAPAAEPNGDGVTPTNDEANDAPLD